MNDSRTMPYKYNLKAMLVQKFGARKAGLRKEIATFLGVSTKTVGEDLNIRRNETQTIPHARIMLWAQFLDKEVETIFNTDIKNNPCK